MPHRRRERLRCGAGRRGPRVKPCRRPLLIVVLLGAVLASSCATINRLLPSQRAAQQRAIELQELQLQVMRFADEYAGRVYEPIERFEDHARTPEERLAAQAWQLSQATAAYTIASGPNPITNSLDMVVLATLSRMVLEDHWVNELYGQRAALLRDVHRGLEPQAWTLLDGELTPDQIDQLHRVIDDWRAEHPQVRAVSYIHFRDFAMSIRRPKSQSSGGSLFALLGLDPLANLDPAVQEIAQTRQLAERAIYYLQRMPKLLDMQVERLTYEFAVMPETKEMLENANRISVAAAAAGVLASELPDVIAKERHAAIDEFMAALNSEQVQMRELLTELRGTLDAGAATSDSVNATIRSLESLVARFDTPAPARATESGGTVSRPFDITEYTATARELAVAAQQLQALVAQLDSSGAGVELLTASASRDFRVLVDHAFWRGIQLILVLVGAILVAAMIYRYVVARIARSAR